jgi:hypothetical protein
MTTMSEYPQIVAPLRIVGDVTAEPRQVGSLRYHRAWSECGLENLAVPGCLKSSDPMEPLYISTSGIVLRGLDQFQALRSRPSEKVNCIVYPWTEDEALQWILEQSVPQNGPSPYARFLLATELLGDRITELARENMRLGGKYKGFPNLENLSEVHRNREIARIARVAVGYVGYAQKLRRQAADEIKQALLTGELPIYRAFAFLKDCRSQQECLARFRSERTRPVDVRQAMRDLRKQKEGGEGLSVDPVCSGILRIPAEIRDKVRVGRIRTKGNVLLVSNDLLDQLDRTGDLFDGR